MTNICRQHFERTIAAQEAEAAASQHGAMTMEGFTAYEQQLAQLGNDKARLKNIQSTEGKVELKRKLLPEYDAYIAGVLEGGQGAQDDVLTTLMIWRIDVGDYPGALDIATYVLQHKLQMPDRFERTTGCVIAEEIAEAAKKAHGAGASFDRAILQRTADLTADEDMPDEARAKLMLSLGRAILEGLTLENPGKPGQVQQGIDLLGRAIELHAHCGGKTDKAKAEKLLKNLGQKA
ncbi:phage terminase small subunit [Pseudomonas sp. C9-3]|uniref:phage terminase small subunit n=1 Tax=Pseudomonas sp. C9-3 TaxID=3078264 RepID=UPI0028E5F06A|nr:phage terminase small subunit [Pseudomonas sp. C9-3]